MKRRDFLGAGLALAADYALGLSPAGAGAQSRVRPATPGWPADADWAALGQATAGRLSRLAPPTVSGPGAKALLSNPFYVGDQPALTQSSGWLDAWRSSPSAYMVAAERADDVAAAIRFAQAHNVRLVIKGRGHSYLGTSSAPDSLLVWTRKMDAVSVHEAFVPAGSTAPGVPAVSAGAGCMWLHVYQAVTGGAGRYVQGGGCTTVGVAGLVQGGGFGSLSKAYGTAAASLLEAEIVTADGETRVVNHVRNPDLFWAIKGGGGGAFGVVTRLTLATHELPTTIGAVSLSLRARSDNACRRLLSRFIDLYATTLFNAHWGEQVRVGPDNRFDVKMVFQGLTPAAARDAWKPLIEFADAHREDYEGQKTLTVGAVPARLFWSPMLFRLLAPSAISPDRRPGAASSDFWWSGNTEEVGAFWHAYTSAWLPASLLEPQTRSLLADAWFAASRHWGVSLHFNKGLAGGAPAAVEATRDTAMNPDVLDAFALAIAAASGPPAFSGMPAPDREAARADRARVQSAMAALRAAAPGTGTYLNECDYFQADWQRAFWGPNYARLARVKRTYDPHGLFFVHHGVGSEEWSADGFSRLP